jgi:PAS domain-containing protein
MPYNPFNLSRSNQRPRQVRRFQPEQSTSAPELELPLYLKLQEQAQPKPTSSQEKPPASPPTEKAEAPVDSLAVQPSPQELDPSISSDYILQTVNAAISHFRLNEQYHYCCDYCSPGTEAILGYSVSELKQRPQLWRSQVWEADWTAVVKPALEKLLRIAQADPHQYYKSQFEFRFQRKSGFPGWMSTTVSCRYNPQTHYWYLTVVQIEIPAIDLQRRDTSPHSQLNPSTSSAQPANGHTSNGSTKNRHTSNGHTSNGHSNDKSNGTIQYANGNGYSNGSVTTTADLN